MKSQSTTRRPDEAAPNLPITSTRLQETDGCRTRTAVQEQHVQMFAGQNDGILHGAVADVNPGKPSVGNSPILVAFQRDGPVRLVAGNRLRMAHPLCAVSCQAAAQSMCSASMPLSSDHTASSNERCVLQSSLFPTTHHQHRLSSSPNSTPHKPDQ
jgi:hypothetical protein